MLILGLCIVPTTAQGNCTLVKMISDGQIGLQPLSELRKSGRRLGTMALDSAARSTWLGAAGLGTAFPLQLQGQCMYDLHVDEADERTR